MSVVVSLLRAIDRADGEALVMHVGEKPYVVTAAGHAELASKELTIPAMTGMLDQLLPPDSRHALEELGAVEYHLPQQHDAPGMRYSIVAARGGDDIWIEVRRRKEEPPAPEVAELPDLPEVDEGLDLRKLDVALEPEPERAIDRLADQPVTLAGAAEYPLELSGPIAVDLPEPPVEEPERADLEVPQSIPVAAPEPEPVLLIDSDPEPFVLVDPEPAPVLLVEPEPALEPIAAVEREAPVISSPKPEPEPVLLADPEPAFEPPVVVAPAQLVAVPEPVADLEPEPVTLEYPVAPIDLEGVGTQEEQAAIRVEAPPEVTEERAQPDPPVAAEYKADVVELSVTSEPDVEEPAVNKTTAAPQIGEGEVREPETPHHPAIIVPMTRAVRHDAAPRPQTRSDGLPHLLQLAASQGASVLYVAAQAKPSLRVDGEIRVLDHETPLTQAQLEAGMLAILPAGSKVSIGEMQPCDVPGVGRVQVLSFADHRGLGAMFRMLPARAISSEQMGLGAPIQALCTETEGLLLVAGVRGSGKSTLTAALVDQINRTRRDHVITIEQQIQFVHENRQSFVSQREARDEDAFAAAVRSALREGPDVLIIDQVTSAETATFALHAASNGHLVVAAVTAPTTSTALGRFVDFFGEERAQARATLSDHLRGVVTQTLLRKTGGGRAAAREVLVNVPSVAAMIADGAFDQLGSVLNGGRRVGMVPLNDALLGLVQSGALDVREAYRKSPDQHELVTMLNRAGLDTTFAERLA